MTMKLGLLALALAIAWFVLIRPAARSASDIVSRQTRKSPAPASLEPCPTCGVYRVPGGQCNCPPGSAGAK